MKLPHSPEDSTREEDQEPAAVRLLDSWFNAASESPMRLAAQYSSQVGKIKYVLAIVTMLLLAALIFWPLIYPVSQPLKLSFSAAETDTAEPSRMLKPRFHGIDKHNRPYNIRAEVAYQRDESVIAANNLNGEISLDGERFVMLKADSGEVTVDAKNLVLNGDVNLFTSDGYEIKTDEVHADLGTSIAWGRKPVNAQGPVGTLEATGFHLDAYENVLHFDGRVNVRIYPPKRSKKK